MTPCMSPVHELENDLLLVSSRISEHSLDLLEVEELKEERKTDYDDGERFMKVCNFWEHFKRHF